MKTKPKPYVIGKFIETRKMLHLEALKRDRATFTTRPAAMERFRTRQRAWDIIKQRKLSGRRCINVDNLLTGRP